VCEGLGLSRRWQEGVRLLAQSRPTKKASRNETESNLRIAACGCGYRKKNAADEVRGVSSIQPLASGF